MGAAAGARARGPDRHQEDAALRARASTPAEGTDRRTGDTTFLEGGREAARELESALQSVGHSFAQTDSVLDLGCGSGRVLPDVAALGPDAESAGCDVDAAAIVWAASHHPSLRWSESGFEPPLPFPDQSFELVYSISVFSHLDEGLQDRWLAEVHRVLRPGGVALLSVHGQHAFEQFRTGQATTGWCRRDAFSRAPLRSSEFLFEPYARSVWNEAELPGVGDGYGLAFHGGRYVRERWGQWLQVNAVLERAMTSWQDIVVCSA